MRGTRKPGKNAEKWGDGALATALDALAWATHGAQLALPGLETQRFYGIAPAAEAPDVDSAPGKVGRPQGSRDAVPAAFRRYLVAKYGSAVEGLSAEANRPLAAIAGELAQAFVAVSAAFGRPGMPTSDQIGQWVTLAANLRMAARRYAAPFQTSPAPTQPAGSGQTSRVAVGLFTGQPAPAEIESGASTLAGILNIEVNQGLSGDGLDGSEGEGSEVDE